MTQNVFGIKVNNDEEGSELEKFIKTEGFDRLNRVCRWAGFATDFRAFSNLRYGFWREL